MSEPSPKPPAKNEKFAEQKQQVKASEQTVKRDATRVKFDSEGLLAIPFFAVFAWGGMGTETLKLFALFGIFLLMVSYHAHILKFYKISGIFKFLTILASYVIVFWLILREFFPIFP